MHRDHIILSKYQKMHPEKSESYERLETPQPYRYSKRVIGTAVGINIGTTYSRVAAWSDKHNCVEIIPNKQGNKNTPSCVAWDGTELLIGEAAKKFLSTPTNPKTNVFDLKRLMGIGFNDGRVQKNIELWPFMGTHGDAENSMLKFELKSWSVGFSCEDIYSMILRDLKEAAEVYLGKIVTHVVITVPDYFSDEQRQLIKDASTLAGLNVMCLIDEPTSTAIAYGLDKSIDLYCPKEKNVVVVDMGGRTFDVSLLNLNKAGTFSVKASSGDPHLGGEVFDQLMVNHCVREFKKKERDVTKSAKAMMRLKVACEKAKRDLYLTTQTFIEIRYRGLDLSIGFSREEFEELNASYYKECIEHVKICLRDGKMHKKDVDDVVIVGGSTLIPNVQQMLMEFFDGKPLCKSINPDECVAYGASLLAANLGGNGNELVQDVTPISLCYGIDEDDMCVVLPRNSPIPTIKEVFFLTESDKPVSLVAINVYEGESCKTTENHLLGSLLLDIVPVITQTVKLCFAIDESGILNVSGEVLSTGCKKSITIDGSTKNSWKQLIKKIF